MQIRAGRAALTFACVIAMVATTALSPVRADNPVIDPIIDRGVVVQMQPYVEIPDSRLGRARINNFATADGRLFVVEDYDGKIYEITRTTSGGEVELFFDVRSAIAAATDRRMDNTSVFHGGLRSVAFHPNFATNGLFYTSLMETRSNSLSADDYLSNATNPIIADGVVIEWRANVNTGQVDPDTYRQLFRVGMPVYDHPIKQIAFNPFAEPGDDDFGLLYVAHGDGSVQSATAGGGFNNDALGKILRIDPTPSRGNAYTVPLDNPFVGDPSMLDEVWSLGHRNPHHLAFAEDADGEVHLIAAEAGRDNVEEVNIIVPGANYGWSEREGTFVHLSGGGLGTGVASLPANEAENGYTYPAAQYGHEGARGTGFSGQSIAGGYVIDNGSALDGEYFYSDFPRAGRFFHSLLTEMLDAVTLLDPDDPDRDAPGDLTQAPTGSVSILFDHDSDPATRSLVRTNLLDVFNDAPRYDGSGRADVRFGQGPDGELYISSKKNGLVYLVTNSVPPTGSCEGLLATTAGLTGTPGDDVIVGTGGDDVIDGGAGDDVICGRGGADVISGGSGNDIIYAGWGADVVRGGNGHDTIDGSLGNDQLAGGNGDDSVDGGDGNDRLEGGAGEDILRGDKGHDALFGGDHGDRLFGGKGNDTLRGSKGHDTLFGNRGEDRLFGGKGDDVLRGGSGDDALFGNRGEDRLFGGEGNDALGGA